MVSSYSTVTTTCATLTESDLIVDTVLAAKLAACVQVSKVESHYVWEGKIAHEPELLLTMKTQTNKVPTLMAKIASVHPYKVPQILAYPIQSGHLPYLKWIDESLA